MGLKRWIKHVLIPTTIYTDMARNMMDEGSVAGGLKRSIKQEYCEDNPLTTPIYKSGKYDGKVEGYAEASDEYEKKLLKQADEFLKQKNQMQEIDNQKERLLDELCKEIERLENKVDCTEREKKYLQELLLREHRIYAM